MRTIRRFLLCLACLAVPAVSEAADCRDLYALIWIGTAADHAKFARQMGYDCIGYMPGMETDPNTKGMKFFIQGPPEYHNEIPPYPSVLRFHGVYSSAQIDWFNKNFSWKANVAFPDNLACGWWFQTDDQGPDGVGCFLVPDFQQQAVIDTSINVALAQAAAAENPANDFTFGGFMWDVPDLTGDFWNGRADRGGSQVAISYWTGTDSTVLHSGITHEYATYQDAKAALYIQLFSRMRQQWPESRLFMEPWDIYDNWLALIKNRLDYLQLMPNYLMLSEEKESTNFVDDSRIFADGLMTKDRVATSAAYYFTEEYNRTIAARAAINGAWFNWFGAIGGLIGDMPIYTNTYEVPARLQLIGRLPSWDNFMVVPLADRSWNGTVYSSPNSRADGDVIYSRHWKTGKIFVVFLNASGTVTLREGETVTEVQRTDNYFIESGDGISDVSIVGNAVTLTNLANLGKGYIFTTHAPAPGPSIWWTETFENHLMHP